MNPIVVAVVLGFLLFGTGVALLCHVINSHNWRRNMEDFYVFHRNGKYWVGWVCLLLGVLIMVAPILPFILS